MDKESAYILVNVPIMTCFNCGEKYVVLHYGGTAKGQEKELIPISEFRRYCPFCGKR